MKTASPLLALMLTFALLSGCATSRPTNDSMKPLCVLAGALVGGAAGHAIEDDKPAVAVGAVTGGILAWVFCDREADGDGDGVVDSKDDCRGTPKGATVNASGCPLDRDGDGVPDSDDQCPDTSRGLSVNRQGCVADSDGDGITDDNDRCPSTPRDVQVDNRGCPLASDADGDGVHDADDQCPGTPRGKTVNDRGCHTILSLEGVNFNTNSAELGQQARDKLDRVVKMLKADQNIRLKVEGHTDDAGAEDYNQWLSQRRAEAVVEYLVKRGIDADRLTARGYGEASPIADNATPKGRSMNRRVDLVDSK